MSKRVALDPSNPRVATGEPFLFIKLDVVRGRVPSVAAKLRPMARCAALAVLAAVGSCGVVEPIGIEPMT